MRGLSVMELIIAGLDYALFLYHKIKTYNIISMLSKLLLVSAAFSTLSTPTAARQCKCV
jgi:hypothetical protein